MAEFIETKDDVIAHLSVALEENDIDSLLSILNALARSRGMVESRFVLDTNAVIKIIST